MIFYFDFFTLYKKCQKFSFRPKGGFYPPNPPCLRHCAPSSVWMCSFVCMGVCLRLYGFVPSSVWVCAFVCMGDWVCLRLHERVPSFVWVCAFVCICSSVSVCCMWGRVCYFQD